jgi:DMSO/TMAO reductase YedYZ heme-binding membrane subunit
MAGHFWWYTARAGGIVAWALVLASCLWGVFLALRGGSRQLPAAWLLSAHRYLSMLALCFIGVHVLALIADSYVKFTVVDVLVPMASTWHPLAVAFGIVSMYLVVAIEITSLLRHRMAVATWRGIHVTAYAVLALSTIHFLSAGTDARAILPTSLAVLIGVVVVFITAAMLTWRSAPKVRSRPVITRQ